MTKHFCVSVTFLDGRFHGRLGNGSPEWPPSPLRLFQSIVAANSAQMNSENVATAFRWLESQPPPKIVAPSVRQGAGYVLSVPNNAMDIIGRAWSKGNYFGRGDANPSTHRTMKRVRPVQMLENETVHFLWPLDDSVPKTTVASLADAARRIFCLGCGIDQVVADANVVNDKQASELQGASWKPGNISSNSELRTPRNGTLDRLRKRHGDFLSRVTLTGFVPVDPMREFETVPYRNAAETVVRPHVVFELRADDGNFFSYPQRKLIHIAGMVRHLAIETMKGSPPPGIVDTAEWLDRYVAGHTRDYKGPHRQLSYIPLPTIGHAHADPAVRRVMIVAPAGDEQVLEHLAMRLAGQQLKPTKKTPIDNPPTLAPVHRDNVTSMYTRPANSWASVTPVILPGHNDRRAAKTVKLIEKAFRESGIEQPCTFEWRTSSWWPKSLTAHKYDRNKKPTGYFRPNHLASLSLVHLKIRFDEEISVPGPIIIGAGRHCGLGLFASVQNESSRRL